MDARPPIRPIHPGFNDPALQSQAVFRIVLDAMARPARPIPLPTELIPPPPLFPATAAVLLTLADFESPVWLDEPASASASFVRFHTGAPVVGDPAAAHFAVVSDATRMPAFDSFASGTPEYPDRSATLLVQVETMTEAGLSFEGPGIEGRVSLGASPLPADFTERLTLNRSLFPRGVDLLFLTATHIAALPRSARLVRG